MGSDRGAANIKHFNAERENRNLALVEHALQACRKRRLQFKSFGLLAAYLSDRTGIHRTTFLRNLKYKVVLTVYVQSQAGAASIVNDATDNPYVLKAKLASTQAEVGLLRQEVKRLAAQLRRATTALQHAPGANSSDVEFSNLAALLCLVLIRAETFVVDSKAQSLVDFGSRPSDRLVGGPERTATFIRWLEKNASLPFVKAVKRA